MACQFCTMPGGMHDGLCTYEMALATVRLNGAMDRLARDLVDECVDQVMAALIAPLVSHIATQEQHEIEEPGALALATSK